MILKILAAYIAVRSIGVIYSVIKAYRDKENPTKIDFIGLCILVFPDPVIIFLAVRYIVKGGF